MPRRRAQQIGTPMFAFCEHCGTDFRTDLSPHPTVCGDCLAERYFRCDVCGGYRQMQSGMHRLQDTEQTVCNDCLRSSGFRCEHCNEVYSDAAERYHTPCSTICEHCADNHYSNCHRCGDLLHDNDLYEYDEEDYCSDCYDAVADGETIKSYSYKPCPIMYRAGHEGVDGLVFGIELEMDGGCSGLAAERIAECFTREVLYFKYDGSVSDGMELVTHPISPSLLFSPKGRNKTRQVIKAALSQNMRSHDSGACGLHVHVNRNFFGNGKTARVITEYKFMTLFDRFYEAMRIFARRKPHECGKWAQKPNFTKTKGDSWIANAQRADNYGRTDRYFAVNITNFDTIEIRIFRGTLRFETLMATLQFVCGLCWFIKGTTPSVIDRINWYELCDEVIRCCPYSCRELEGYLYERELAVKEA